MFALVALGAVALTSWLTLGAAFRAQQDIMRVVIDGQTTLEIPVQPFGFNWQRPRSKLEWWFGPHLEQFDQQFDGPSFAPARSAARDLLGKALLAAVLAFVLSSLAASVLTRRLTRPLLALADGARRFAAGQRGIRIAHNNRDEIGEVTDAFNLMASNLERQEAWRRSVVADIAHDLRTPLAVMRSEVEAMQDGISQPDAPGLERLHGEVMLLSKLVDDLRTLSLAEGGGLRLRLESVRLATFLGMIVERFNPRAFEAGSRLQLDVKDDLFALLDQIQFSRVINNLLENAVRHGGTGLIELSAAADGEWIKLTVRDHGPGLRTDDLERAFERFYQADASRTRQQVAEINPAASKGSGLGLAIARAIVEAHAGRIEASNHPQGGALLTLRLPRQTGAVA